MLYKIADHIIEINIHGASKQWETVASHYEPFAIESGEPLLRIDVNQGAVLPEAAEGMTLMHSDPGDDKEFLSLKVYQSAAGAYYFQITEPGEPAPNASVLIDPELRHAQILLDCKSGFSSDWFLTVSLTSTIQVAFMMATTPYSTILTHSSCILKDGRTYLFLGKSGTGKSTHSRLWLKNVEGSTLLNDDHPVIRVAADGEVIAYGSPWSGKTHCYRNLQAPIGAIVRIKRAPYDAIHRQSVIAAYASLITSFSGLTIDSRQADLRHRTIEHIVEKVPCYELECLPDDQAAIVCSTEVLP